MNVAAVNVAAVNVAAVNVAAVNVAAVNVATVNVASSSAGPSIKPRSPEVVSLHSCQVFPRVHVRSQERGGGSWGRRTGR